MDNDKEKRNVEEFLFKWDGSNSNSLNFEPFPTLNERDIKRRLIDPREGSNLPENTPKSSNKSQLDALKLIFRDSATKPLSGNTEKYIRGGTKGSELVEDIKAFQFETCKEWLCSDKKPPVLTSSDTLNRLSFMILNPEFLIKNGALNYNARWNRSEYELYNAAYLAKLGYISNSPIIEITRQPVYVRNRLLLSKETNKCNCPIGVFPSQTPTLAQRTLQTQNYSPATSGAEQQANKTTLGHGFLTRVSGNTNTTHQSNTVVPWEKTLHGSNNFGLSVNNQAESVKLGAPLSNTVTNPIANLNQIPNSDVLCPLHNGKQLPDAIIGTNCITNILEDLSLVYKYEEVTISNKVYHVLSFHKLSCDSTKVWQYKLPSKLCAIKSVYVKDFELERGTGNFNFAYNSTMDTRNLWANYLCTTYTGNALFIVTRTEILLCVVKLSKNNEVNANTLTLGVILRDKNPGYQIKDVVCHKKTGRIFLLSSGSLLYEYQYQLGFAPKSFTDHPVFVFLAKVKNEAIKFISKLVKPENVHRLYGTVSTGYIDPEGYDIGDNEDDAAKAWWNGRGNCLGDLNKPAPKKPCSYWPPIIWKELYVALHDSTFSETRKSDACDCTEYGSCASSDIQRHLKLLNPWNKSMFDLFSVGESIITVDEKRWLVSLLNLDSGDLSVYKIPSACSLQQYLTSVETYDRIFPYDLTLYNLKSSQMTLILGRLGFSRYGGSPSLKYTKVFPAPIGFIEGVDIVLVDTNGTRVFVGFSAGDNKITLSVKGFRMAHNLNAQPTGQRPMGYVLSNFSMPIFRSKNPLVNVFIVDDLFVTAHTHLKSETSTILRITVTSNDSTSFFQPYLTHSLSVSEELWSHNQTTNVSVRNGDEDIMPTEWFDTFYIRLAPGENLVSMILLNPKSTDENKTLLLITTNKVYSFSRASLLKYVETLVKYPLTTTKLLDLPTITKEYNLLNSRTCDKNHYDALVPFIDLFRGKDSIELCSETIKRGSVGQCLYYLSWMYTSENIFKTCWEYLSKVLFKNCDITDSIDSEKNMIKELMINSDTESSLVLTSLGISPKIFDWIGPGCYAINEGVLEKPVVSPWCKFISFGSVNRIKCNRATANLNSQAIDGLLSLISKILEPFWVQRSFISVPLFTTLTTINNGTIPVDLGNQLGNRNEFVVGCKVHTDLVLKLSKPLDDIKSTLEELRVLYLLVGHLMRAYDKVDIEKVVEKITRLPLNVQKEIIKDSNPSKSLLESANGLSEGISRWAHDRFKVDTKILNEIATILEISQEYIACCELINEKCKFGNIEYDFDKLLKNMNMLPSKSPYHNFTSHDLSFLFTKANNTDEIVSPFSLLFSSEEHKNTLEMSHNIFSVISHSNMLNL
ncbi:conserved hypothetical protein [Theileria equi strain WA]|uniref:Uncharacterized protein n=1 Tax=Theileria equi strain WA TaxID=1537102 RepID=L1LCX5_THEEQ|nr:conserved hypothetical protein [Theileria equi strain WA]EKX73262.1 conserved hypothetical protein [Theileria equi strain WA]|eukprot:XP_004832714.1 conserved hypothetical protein [Theileria equi strain WA]